MLKPPLVFMHVRMLVDDPVITWPELGQVHVIDAEQEMKTYESHGGAVAIVHGPCVVSIPEGSEHALYILEREMNRDDVLCISVRRSPGTHRSWWSRLDDAAKERGIELSEHERHHVLSTVAYRLFKDGFRAISDCADMVRGEGVDPSPEAMRTEKALSKAIEVLRSAGFSAPRKV